MHRSLYFTIVLILMIFILTVMTVVGASLITGISSYFSDDFYSAMDACFDEDTDLSRALSDALEGGGGADSAVACLSAFSASLGLDDYRSYAVLDRDAVILAASESFLEKEGLSVGDTVRISANIAAVLRGKTEQTTRYGEEAMDYCVARGDILIYILDTKEETKELNWMLFEIILQSLLIGFLFAVILSFFLAKTITSPIRSLTRGAQSIAEGNFSEEIDVRSDDEIGTLTETFNHMKDILKNTLDQVSGEREKLETVFYYLKDAVVAFRENGSVMHENTTAHDLFAPYLEGHALTLKLLLEICTDNAGEVMADFELMDGETKTISAIPLGDRVFDMSIGQFRYHEGKLPMNGMIAMLHDVTGRYELDRSRREFVANVSHELRTPLTSIKGAAETVLNYPDMSPEMRESFLSMAVEESDRMTRIVGDLLVLSRLDNNRTKWEISTFAPDAMLRHLVEVVRHDAEEHHHRISLRLPPSLPKLTADRDRVEQILLNILTNAIKYTPDGGRIRIHAMADEDGIAIAVRDSGIGIPPEDLPHICERFYRVEKSRTTGAGGTGLGLAIAKELCEAHGGLLNIDSTVGVGTTVTVFLPLECAIGEATL